ncbi:MAG: hypothetical protein M1828_006024 [Chrysothrix sp. TS-e1954]|nr:MAG: hypothetical protein M1828_006024 [Chrysothrix sp. TS-e1954]
MAAVGKYAAKKVLGQQMSKYEKFNPAGDTDPYFTTIKLPNGKVRKFRKQIPDYIPEDDAKILAKCKHTAYRLDIGYSICGMRVGKKTIIGLIPELGDVIDLALAEKLIRRCKKIEGGLPSKLQSKMRLYAIAAFGIGLAPYVGDFIDNFLRYNMRNVALLEDYLKEKYGPEDKMLRKLSGLEDCGDADARAYLAQYPDRNRPRSRGFGTEKPVRRDHSRLDDRHAHAERAPSEFASGNEKAAMTRPGDSARSRRV